MHEGHANFQGMKGVIAVLSRCSAVQCCEHSVEISIENQYESITCMIDNNCYTKPLYSKNSVRDSIQFETFRLEHCNALLPKLFVCRPKNVYLVNKRC